MNKTPLNNKRIIPVILAGGSGTRLWPLSRRSFPKQFLKLVSNHSLLQETVMRTKKVIDFSKLVVVTNTLHHYLCEEQLKPIFNGSTSYILEPCGRNTAPAIALAAHYINDHLGEDSLMLALPADHLIAEEEELKRSLMISRSLAQSGKLVIFGVTPTDPKTGYGYIQAIKETKGPPYPVRAFIEKPQLSTAEEFLSSGEYYWNSGMFLFKPSSYVSELKECTPDIYQHCLATYQNSTFNENALSLNVEHFSKCPSDSIDYAVMEKTSKAMMTPLNTSWNDLGSWISVAETHPNSTQKNIIHGNVVEKHSNNCFVHADNRWVSIIGLENQIVISTPDAVLVANKDYVEDIKEVVNELDAIHTPIVRDHQKTFFKWGYEESIEISGSSELKRIVIKPNAYFSPPTSQDYEKHWLIISGKGEFTNSYKSFTLKFNEGLHLSKNESYKIKNNGENSLILIETTIKSPENEEALR